MHGNEVTVIILVFLLIVNIVPVGVIQFPRLFVDPTGH